MSDEPTTDFCQCFSCNSSRFVGSTDPDAYVERAAAFFDVAARLKRLAFKNTLAVLVTNQESLKSKYALPHARLCLSWISRLLKHRLPNDPKNESSQRKSAHMIQGMALLMTHLCAWYTLASKHNNDSDCQSQLFTWPRLLLMAGHCLAYFYIISKPTRCLFHRSWTLWRSQLWRHRKHQEWNFRLQDGLSSLLWG